jgi:hypothetical protein
MTTMTRLIKKYGGPAAICSIAIMKSFIIGPVWILL